MRVELTSPIESATPRIKYGFDWNVHWVLFAKNWGPERCFSSSLNVVTKVFNWIPAHLRHGWGCVGKRRFLSSSLSERLAEWLNHGSLSRRRHNSGVSLWSLRLTLRMRQTLPLSKTSSIVNVFCWLSLKIDLSDCKFAHPSHLTIRAPRFVIMGRMCVLRLPKRVELIVISYLNGAKKRFYNANHTTV